MDKIKLFKSLKRLATFFVSGKSTNYVCAFHIFVYIPDEGPSSQITAGDFINGMLLFSANQRILDSNHSVNYCHLLNR